MIKEYTRGGTAGGRIYFGLDRSGSMPTPKKVVDKRRQIEIWQAKSELGEMKPIDLSKFLNNTEIDLSRYENSTEIDVSRYEISRENDYSKLGCDGKPGSGKPKGVIAMEEPFIGLTKVLLEIAIPDEELRKKFGGARRE